MTDQEQDRAAERRAAVAGAVAVRRQQRELRAQIDTLPPARFERRPNAMRGEAARRIPIAAERDIHDRELTLALQEQHAGVDFVAAGGTEAEFIAAVAEAEASADQAQR